MEQELTVILTEAEKRTTLSGRWFAFLQLTEVDLSGAVFCESDLEGARFVQTDLHGADFRRVNLHGAIFSFCDLYGANFTDACLEGATFHRSVGLSPTTCAYIRSRGGVVQDTSGRIRHVEGR